MSIRPENALPLRKGSSGGSDAAVIVKKYMLFQLLLYRIALANDAGINLLYAAVGNR